MSSHYKQIKGIRYSAPLLAKADELVDGQGDGRIGLEDAKQLFNMLGKDGKYSDLEKRSIAYVQENYSFTEEGDSFLREQISSWSSGQDNKKKASAKKVASAPKNEKKTEVVSTIKEGSSHRRVLTGKVVSNKPAGGKTIVVEVIRKVVHPKYKKFVQSRSKYYAHDEDNVCQINDEVTIQESRPLSKTKRWIVVEHTSVKH